MALLIIYSTWKYALTLYMCVLLAHLSLICRCNFFLIVQWQSTRTVDSVFPKSDCPDIEFDFVVSFIECYCFSQQQYMPLAVMFSLFRGVASISVFNSWIATEFAGNKDFEMRMLGLASGSVGKGLPVQTWEHGFAAPASSWKLEGVAHAYNLSTGGSHRIAEQLV